VRNDSNVTDIRFTHFIFLSFYMKIVISTNTVAALRCGNFHPSLCPRRA
jgi:hypothetical protein